MWYNENIAPLNIFVYFFQLTELRDEMDVFRTKHERLSRQTETERVRKVADIEKVK